MKPHSKPNREISKTKTFFTLITIAAISGGLYYKFVFLPKKHATLAAMQAASQQQPPQALPVSVIEITSGGIILNTDYPARIRALKIADVRPQVSGVVYKKLFTEGSFVKKGQPLYQIDPFERVVVKAPISGHIGRTLITEGTLVSANQTSPLAQINQIDKVYVDIPIPSADALRLKQYNQFTVELNIDDVPYKQSFRTVSIDSSADETTDTVMARFIFDNAEGNLIPGMFANASITVQSEGKITIPQRVASFTPEGKMFVWVVEEGTIKHRMIEADGTAESAWIVKSGLQEGELVVSEGFQKIKEGMPVEPKVVGI